MKRPISGKEPLLVFGPPTIQSRGDGSVVMMPGKPRARLTPLEFARHVGLSRSTIYAAINSGLIPPSMVIRSGLLKIFILAEAVEAWPAYCAEYQEKAQARRQN